MWALDLGELLSTAQPPREDRTIQRSGGTESSAVPCDDGAGQLVSPSLWGPDTPMMGGDLTAPCTIAELRALYRFREWEGKRPRDGTAFVSGALSPGEGDSWRPGFLCALSALQHHPRWLADGCGSRPSSFWSSLHALVEHMVSAPSALYSSSTMTLMARLLHHHLGHEANPSVDAPCGDVSSTPHPPQSFFAVFGGMLWRRYRSHAARFLCRADPTADLFVCDDELRQFTAQQHREAAVTVRAIEDAVGGPLGANFLDSLLICVEEDQGGPTVACRSSSFLADTILSSFLFPVLVACDGNRGTTPSSVLSGFSFHETRTKPVPMHVAILLDAFAHM